MKAEELLQGVINAWNAQADEYNQWHELDANERVEFAMRTIREAEQQASRKKLIEAIKIIEAEDCDQTEYLCHALYRCAEAVRALIEREET